ncbi:MAG: hypothetical protein MJ170_00870 [Alphaproteobacteria bacterium]|nr:hypothetical protein [Alphaproteobacteria bacterium]
MTIGIGVLCRDGVVIASDGMCSVDQVGVDNLKTHIVKNRIVCCCAGADNYLRFFLNFLNLKFEDFQFDVPDRTADAIISDITKGFYNFINELMITKVPEHTKGLLIQKLHNDFLQQIQFVSVIGFYHCGEFYLYKITGLMISPIQSSGMWYTIIGSGFTNGMPSIHLIKKIIQIDSIPNVANAVNLAYWTVDHAIEVSSAYIGGNVAIASIRKNNDNTFSVQTENTEQCKGFVEDVYRHIKTYFEQPAEVARVPEFNAEETANCEKVC